MNHYDFLIIGGGIFGLTAALALRDRQHKVAVLNPQKIPHPLAASTDISKVVRMEYGADKFYMNMVDEAIDGWKSWNELYNDTLYHEVGFLMLCKGKGLQDTSSFEATSYRNLLEAGHQPEWLSQAELEHRYPALQRGVYSEAIFNPRAGYAESGRAVQRLLDHARQAGAVVHEGQTAARIETDKGRVVAVHTREGERFSAGTVVVCAGAYTQVLLPELEPFMKATGHPVFHVKPSQPELYGPPFLPVFSADISNSGWYGFPLHPRENVVKFGNHGIGQHLHPERDERLVNQDAILGFRNFLQDNFPGLATDPIVFTRRCLYSDTLDGHFWINRHPEIEGLAVAAGGSGHGFKMAPVLGDIIADMAEGRPNRWLSRFRWRMLGGDTGQEEEARFKGG